METEPPENIVLDGRCVAAQPDGAGGKTDEDKNECKQFVRGAGNLNERRREFDRKESWNGQRAADIQSHIDLKDLTLHGDEDKDRKRRDSKRTGNWRDRDSSSRDINHNVGFKEAPSDRITDQENVNSLRTGNWRDHIKQDVGSKKLDITTDGEQCPVVSTRTGNWRDRCSKGTKIKQHVDFQTQEAQTDGQARQYTTDSTRTDNWRDRCPEGPNIKQHVGFKAREILSYGQKRQYMNDSTRTDNWRDRTEVADVKQHESSQAREVPSDGQARQYMNDSARTGNWRDRTEVADVKQHEGFQAGEVPSDGQARQHMNDSTRTGNWRDRTEVADVKQHEGFQAGEVPSDGQARQYMNDSTRTGNWRDRTEVADVKQHEGFQAREVPSDGQARQYMNDSTRTGNWRDRTEVADVKQHEGFQAREVPSDGQTRQYMTVSSKTSSWREGTNVKREVHSNRETGYHGRLPNGTGTQRYESFDLVLSQLEELTDKDPSTIVLTLNSRIHSLMDQHAVPPNVLFTFVSLIAQGIQCKTESSNVSKMLLSVQESNFYEHVSCIFVLLDSNHTEEDKNRCFLKDLITILCELYTRLPHAFMKVKVLGLEEQLKLVIQKLQRKKSNIVDEEIVSKLCELQKLKYSALQKPVTVGKEDREGEPPDDFRALSILPNASDIYAKEDIFLRKNKPIGGYKDLGHYLDVQFRLLKEDFVGPLRDGIGVVAENTKLKQGQRISDVRVYHAVHIVRKVCSANGILHRLHFDVSGLQDMVWEESKSLIYGSLVCLLPDGFDTFILATITDRDPKLLRSGNVDVSIEYGQLEMGYDIRYTMLETTAFFEAYRHVLSALQEIREGELPFEKYIIHCDISQDTPRYLTRYSRSSEYNLQSLTKKALPEHMGSLSHQSTVAVNILEDEDWPTADILDLNPSQYESLRNALTKEFSIIQGPPGTGKTFIGLKIAKALLHNTHQWMKPMLIVCYTNHALDQFLEGIIRFHRVGVIRVGSRISKECLKDYSLSAARRRFRDKETRRIRWERREALTLLGKMLEEEYVTLAGARKSILHENTLFPYMGIFYDMLFDGMETIHAELKLKHGNEVEFPRCVMQEWLGMGKLVATGYLPKDIFLGDELEEKAEVTLGISTAQNTSSSNEDISGFQFPKCRRKNVKQHMMGQLRSSERMTEDEVEQIGEPWSMALHDRWRLYRFWIFKFSEQLERNIWEYEEWYTDSLTEIKEFQEIEDRVILQNATVIGMTTTAAARHRQILSEIGPSIIMIEEAAEVLEGHIISTLSKKCEHLILIGDHKQLKPNPTVYNLAKRYHLDLSLFERMVSNGIHCDTLSVQHRMRPEISSLLRHIYPNLEDHPSVFDYENVKGISTNMFFIDHRNQEESEKHMVSHSNEYEAVYIVALCSYLLKQGYDHSQITVLTTYAGQQRKIRKLMHKGNYPNVKLTVVDNYQGEENDIVLLSLVRSNPEGSVGFLKIENRICVALSRAKIGLFVIGNFELLAMQSLLWKDILKDLRKNKQVGPTLHLYCQNHQRGTGISIESPNDFEKAPDGGCLKPCEFRLNCGHVCTRYCHPYDPEHKEYLCEKPCTEILCSNGHPCPRLCHMKCAPCVVPVQKIIPCCGHEQSVPCSQDPITFSCMNDCEKLCNDGHPCPQLCHEKCAPCAVPVQKIIPSCGHEQIVPCSQDPITFSCMNDCEKLCNDGHPCPQLCHEECAPCSVPVQKIIPSCGHEQIVQCSQDPITFSCMNDCEKLCNDGHPCPQLCHEECAPCAVPVQKIIPSCGHEQIVQCSQDPITFSCMNDCEKLCNDSHPCPQLCHEECAPCAVPVQKIIPSCGHEQIVPCFQDPHDFSCEHNCEADLGCGHRCGEACGKEHQCSATIKKTFRCGHMKEVLCINKDKTDCSVRCCVTLDCGHNCDGNCYTCQEGRLHVPCQKMCKEVLICGHECGAKCSHCPPCRMACENRCPHERCTKFCGDICDPCIVPCEWKCEHFKCTLLCNEPCDRPPCNEPCKKKLPCEHQCIGMCGEPCPSQCRFCNVALVSSVSGKPNARFVFLEDCGHIAEVTSLDRHMESKSDEIELKKCPHCKTIIRHSMRYGNVINSIFRKLEVVKRQCNEQSETVLDTEERMMIEVLEEDECEGDTKEMMLRQGFTNTVAGLTALQNQFTLLDELAKITDEYDRFVGLEGIARHIDFATKEIKRMRTWLMIRRQAFSRHEESDAQNELLRHKVVIHMLDLEFLLGAKSKESEIHGYMLILKDILVSGKPYSAEKQIRVGRIFDRLWGILNIDFSEEIDMTKVVIVPTTGSACGHWLSCRHGHVYSVRGRGYGSKRGCAQCLSRVG